jgi:hypothetical protein
MSLRRSSAGDRVRSGGYWVGWANAHARSSTRVDDLAEPFQSGVRSFIRALEDAGASVAIHATRRCPKRAYLFHWSWKLALGRADARDVPGHPEVPIEWDHGHADQSARAAREMVEGFELALPPRTAHAPALQSNHIAGLAIDMSIRWQGVLWVPAQDGNPRELPFLREVSENTALHALGATYGVHKLVSDASHWSHDGG